MSKGDDAGLPRNTFNVIIRMLTNSNLVVMSTLRALADEENSSEDSNTDSVGNRIKAQFKKVKLSANAADVQLRSFTRALSGLQRDLNSLRGLYPPKRRRREVR